MLLLLLLFPPTFLFLPSLLVLPPLREFIGSEPRNGLPYEQCEPWDPFWHEKATDLCMSYSYYIPQIWISMEERGGGMTAGRRAALELLAWNPFSKKMWDGEGGVEAVIVILCGSVWSRPCHVTGCRGFHPPHIVIFSIRWWQIPYFVLYKPRG